MKKILCVCLCLFLLASAAGCGKKEQEEKKYTADMDVAYYVRLGQLPECGEYSLGCDVDGLIADFEALQQSTETGTQEGDAAFFYFLNEQEDYVSLRTGEAEYCFRPDARDGGISCMVSYTDAFGFESGSISIEIKEALSEYSLRESTGGSGMPFLSTADSTEYYTYTFEPYAVTFVFTDNALCAAAVYDPNEWSLK